MKRFLSVLIVVVVLTAFLPRGSVFAVDIIEAFPNNVPGQTVTSQTSRYLTNTIVVTPSLNTNGESVNIGIMFKVPTPAHDSGQEGTVGQFDTYDDFGSWNAILDSDLENTSLSGVFLEIGKQVDSTLQPNQQVSSTKAFKDYILQKQTFTISDPQVPGQPVNPTTNESGKNIGYYIWKKNPAAFFNMDTVYVNIPVAGLSPNTTYYVRVHVDEEGSDLGDVTSQAYSDTKTFTTAATADVVNETLTSTPNQEGQTSNSGLIESVIDCGITSIDGWVGCINGMLFYVIYVPTQIIVRMAGWIFDVFLGLSISSAIYNNSFITSGWGFIRDLTNIGFIIALIYIAISTIVGSGSSWKKALPNIIIMALLINFSLFMTRVVIDGGNILSSVFYNQINIDNQDSSLISNTPGYVQERSISKGLIAGMGIQNMLSPEFFNSVKQNVNKIQVVIALITILGIALNLALIWTFFMVAWTFLGRIVELWLAMIFSPLAFLSRAVPEIKGKLEGYGWDGWLKNLTSVAFMPAIFLFFVILIIKFATNPITDGILNTGTATDWTALIVAILLKFMIIFILLNKAKTLAISLSGEAGKAIVGVGKMIGGAAIGLAGGAAIGVAGSALRGGASYVGDKVKNSDTFKKIQGAKDDKGLAGWAARKSLKGFEGFEKSSFDLRQSKTMGAIGGALTSKIPGLEDLKGVNFNRDALSKVPLIDLSTKAGEGGYSGAQERAKEKAKKEAYDSLLKGGAADAQDERAEKYKADLDAMKKKYEDQFGEGTFKDHENNFRRQYENGEKEIKIGSVSVQNTAGFGDTRSTLEVNKEKLEKQAELMSAGGGGLLAAASQSLGGALKAKAGDVQTGAGATLGAGAVTTAAVTAGAAAAGATLAGGVGIAGQQYTEQKGRDKAAKELLKEAGDYDKKIDAKQKEIDNNQDAIKNNVQATKDLDAEIVTLEGSLGELGDTIEKLRDTFAAGDKSLSHKDVVDKAVEAKQQEADDIENKVKTAQKKLDGLDPVKDIILYNATNKEFLAKKAELRKKKKEIGDIENTIKEKKDIDQAIERKKENRDRLKEHGERLEDKMEKKKNEYKSEKDKRYGKGEEKKDEKKT